MADLLPEDVLTNIISRLAPRYLAVSRCVCKTWCALIDACNMLRADLLPHSVCGIYINFHDLPEAEFFSRPSKGPTISSYSDYLPHRCHVDDHCNGLLLVHDFVVNPATRQCARLPPCPSTAFSNQYLVFDPTLSPHYEVFAVPHFRHYGRTNRLDLLDSDVKSESALEELEWPPLPCVLHVFSSRTKEWEERSFVREGEAAGNIGELLLYWPRGNQNNAVFRRDVLYVNCQTRFIMRISLSNANYQVIKPPEVLAASDGDYFTDLYLGQSEKGVYCAVYNKSDPFQVYILDESSGKMEWVFKRICSIFPTPSWPRIDEPGPWTLQDFNHEGCDYYGNGCEYSNKDNKKAVGEKLEWDSDSDNVIENGRWGKYRSHITFQDLECRRYFTFLGFHPYKEVIFVCDTWRRGLAYHLNSSKLQDLGILQPTHYDEFRDRFLEGSFPYTPWMGEFPDGDN